MTGFEHFFSRGFPDFGMHAQHMRNRRRPQDMPTKGQELKYVVDVPISKFIFGGETNFTVSYDEPCKSCNGKGYSQAETCDVCKGSGHIVDTHQNQGIFVQRAVPCNKCRGRGEISSVDCDACNGSGKNRVENREFKIPVEKGFRDGQMIIMNGVGRSGTNGGPPGDVLVKLRMTIPDPDSLTEEQKKVLESLE